MSVRTARTPQRLLRVTSVLVVFAAAACSDLTEPPTVSVTVPPTPPPEPEGSAARPAQPAAPAPIASAAPQNDTVGASHILVAYQGSLRAATSITRSKDEARARALQILARARKGEDFGKLADETSDDPSAKMNHGSLGKFTRTQMVKPFADAAFALPPGGISELVETPFGFHVIKRIE